MGRVAHAIVSVKPVVVLYIDVIELGNRKVVEYSSERGL